MGDRLRLRYATSEAGKLFKFNTLRRVDRRGPPVWESFRSSALLERKDDIPVLLHVYHRPSVHGRSVQRDVETTKMRLPVIGIFASSVGVVNDHAEAHAATQCCPLQHLKITIGIAECRDRPAADGFVDADRLARLVVD